MVKKLHKITLKIEVNKEKKSPLPVLVDDDFDIEFKFDNYKNDIRILIDLNYSLTFTNSNEKVIHSPSSCRCRRNAIYEKCQNYKLHDKVCLDFSL